MQSEWNFCKATEGLAVGEKNICLRNRARVIFLKIILHKNRKIIL